MASPGERVIEVVCTEDKLRADLADGHSISAPTLCLWPGSCTFFMPPLWSAASPRLKPLPG